MFTIEPAQNLNAMAVMDKAAMIEATITMLAERCCIF
jgi:hypothetical protein